MDEIIFLKYSNDRDTKFNIVTKVVKGEHGKKSVIKEPVGASAREHIEKLVLNHGILTEKYKEQNVCFSRIEKFKNGVRLEWCEGEEFAKYLDEKLEENDIDGCLQLMSKYFECIFIEQHLFKESKEFEKVFGKVNITSDELAVNNVDLDMIFFNVIWNDGKWVDYDYEWVVSFDIPVKFLIYRCLLYYITTQARSVLLEKNIYEYFGISPEEREIYADMEAKFQGHIQGRHIPMWKLYKKIRGTVVDVLPMEARYAKAHWTQIYYNYGQGYEEKNSKRLRPEEFEKNRYRITFKCPEKVTEIRFDPAWSACVVKILEVRGADGKQLSYISNGNLLEENNIIWFHDDPQIYIPLEKNEKELYIEYELSVIDSDDILKLQKINSKYMELNQKEAEREVLYLEKQELIKTKEILESEKEILENEKEILQERLQNMENSYSWKITKPLRVIKGKVTSSKIKESEDEENSGSRG